MIRLSIIIPFYNVEKYIAQCLDSVVNQDIPLSDYEIICVNDASPDHSRDIVLDYMKRYPNIRLIEHEYNKKLGTARNTGRKAARGKYIWHVDSDDMIAHNCLKTILNQCDDYDLDVIEMGYLNLYMDDISDSVSHYQVPRDNAIYSGPDYFEKFHLDKVHTICGIWRKVYKRSFLDENNIYSPPINMGEDEAFAIDVFGKAKRIAYLDMDCYIYRRFEQSLTGSQKQNWNANKWYEASFICARYMHQAYKRTESNYSTIVRSALQRMIQYDILYWDTFRELMFPSVRKEYWNFCRKDCWKNLFVFRFFSRKKAFHYILNLININV